MSRALRAGLLLLAVVSAGCARRPSSAAAASGGGNAARLSIAEQFGLAYAPLQILRERRLLEAHLPGIEVRWHRLGPTAAIREAMVAGRVVVGFLAVPPFLIARDSGMRWRIFAALSESPLALVSWKPGIRTLADIGPGERIALPQPASVQHVLLAMAAERELGDARRFDRQILTMAHPEAMAALLARGDVAAHFASPPYLGRELAEPGIHAVLTGEQAMGEPFTFIVGVAPEQVLERRGRDLTALTRALAEASAFLARQPAEAAALLAPLYGLPADEVEAELAAPGLLFSPELRGVSAFAAFMHRQGFLGQPAGELEHLLWSGTSGAAAPPATAGAGQP